MPYPPHFRLEWGGDFVSDPSEIWSNSINMTHNPEIDGATFPSEDEGGSTELLNHYWEITRQNFGSSNSGYSTNVRLKYVKFNEIAPSGLRKNPAKTWRKDEGGAGILGSGTPAGPITGAMVVTFLTAASRGRASKGRVFVPHPNLQVSATGGFRYTSSQLSPVLLQWKSFLDALADGPDVDSPSTLVASVVSELDTPGLFRNITNAQIGDFPDYMGSRRNKLKEVRLTSAAVNQTGV